MAYSPEANFPFIKNRAVYDDLKKRTVITIFGSYDKKSKKRLEKIRTKIKQEFPSTFLVIDRTSPAKKENQTTNAHIYEKSLYWVKNSDIVIWIYFIDSDKSGESIEIGSVPFLRNDLNKVIIVRETLTLGKDPPMTRLLSGLSDTYQEINVIDFEKGKDVTMTGDVIGKLRDIIRKI